MDELELLRRKLARAERANARMEEIIETRTRELFVANQELLRASEALAQSRDVAVHATTAKSAFLASMSHELRTPLNAIIGYSEMLSEDLVGGPYHGDVVRIEGAARHLLSLVNDILDLSKIEAGRLELVPEPTAICDLVASLAATAEPLARRNGNTLKARCDAQVDRMVVDPLRLKQILLNLVSNACKFTNQGTIELRVVGREDVVQFDVQDTGLGMGEEVMSRLFRPFEQADGLTARRFGGTGLGLALSRKLAELMNGQLTVTSEPGVGSTFTLVLPVRLAA